MMVRIFHQRNKCIGCNACVEVHRDRWRMSRRDGKSTLVGATEQNGIYTMTVEADEFQSNQRAAMNCPMKIIKVEQLT